MFSDQKVLRVRQNARSILVHVQINLQKKKLEHVQINLQSLCNLAEQSRHLLGGWRRELLNR